MTATHRRLWSGTLISKEIKNLQKNKRKPHQVPLQQESKTEWKSSVGQVSEDIYTLTAAPNCQHLKTHKQNKNKKKKTQSYPETTAAVVDSPGVPNCFCSAAVCWCSAAQMGSELVSYPPADSGTREGLRQLQGSAADMGQGFKTHTHTYTHTTNCSPWCH